MRVAVSIGVMILSGILLALGFNVSSAQYLGRVGSVGILETVGCISMGMLCFSPTNVALLTIISAFIGADLREGLDAETPTSYEARIRNAVAQGIVCFFVAFFGVGWVSIEMILNASQEDYVKLATVSIMPAFVVGYDPRRILALMKIKPTEE